MAGIFKTNRNRLRDQGQPLPAMQSRKSYPAPVQSDFLQPALKKKRSTRIVSMVLTVLLGCAAAAFTLLPQFRVTAPIVTGSENVNLDEINYYTGLRNIPIYMANPDEISNVLLKRYPEARAIDVKVELPSRVTINLVQRVPLIEWDFGGSKIWIDEDGTILREQQAIPGDLIYVLSNSFPGARNRNDRKFPEKFSKKMLTALIEINQSKPQGKTLFYTYDNGYGWQTDQGYTLWIGIDNSNLTEKMRMAESLGMYFKENEIEPEMLSLEFPDAPYFRYAE